MSGATTSMNAGTGRRDRLQIWPTVAIGVCALAYLAGALFFLMGSEEVGAIWSFLFSTLPTGVGLYILFRYREDSGFFGRTSWVTLGAVVFQGVALGIYTGRASLAPWLLRLIGGVAALAGAFLVFGALWLTFHLVRPAGRQAVGEVQRPRFVDTLQQHPFAALCFFLVIFCFVGLFLSYALALHDQGLKLAKERPRYGLWARELPGGPSRVSAADRAGPDGPLPIGEEMSASSLAKTWEVRFQHGSSQVQADRRYEGWNDFQIAELEGEKRRVAQNAQQLRRLVDEVVQYAAQMRVRILLVGHADETGSNGQSSSYQSNFVMSEGRIYQVMVEILRRLEEKERRWRGNVEWLLLPFASEMSFLRLRSDENDHDQNDRLSVEMAVIPTSGSLALQFSGVAERCRSFTLMDYIYFTIYTITTTGYGDIIPVSAYSKFLTSIANMFEVIFVVIFFNVLVVFVGPRLSEPTPPTAESAVDSEFSEPSPNDLGSAADESR